MHHASQKAFIHLNNKDATTYTATTNKFGIGTPANFRDQIAQGIR
jgi:hypothetical protein